MKNYGVNHEPHRLDRDEWGGYWLNTSIYSTRRQMDLLPCGHRDLADNRRQIYLYFPTSRQPVSLHKSKLTSKAKLKEHGGEEDTKRAFLRLAALLSQFLEEIWDCEVGITQRLERHDQ